MLVDVCTYNVASVLEVFGFDGYSSAEMHKIYVIFLPCMLEYFFSVYCNYRYTYILHRFPDIICLCF